jgi:uncharacterized Fe-S cluster-containing radical SAM superfamily enzyme
MPYARQLCFAAARAPETRCRNGRAEIHQNRRLRRPRGAPFSLSRVWRRDECHPPAAGEKTLFPALKRGRLDTLQVNLGYRCNQSCLHCHVNAGAEPHRDDGRRPRWR